MLFLQLKGRKPRMSKGIDVDNRIKYEIDMQNRTVTAEIMYSLSECPFIKDLHFGLDADFADEVNSSFIITSKAKAHPDDTFDAMKGMRIARLRLIQKINIYQHNFLSCLSECLNKEVESLEKIMEKKVTTCEHISQYLDKEMNV